MRIIIFILLIGLCGCYSQRAAEKAISKATAFYPELLAKKARDLFPCVTSKGDTIYVSDSTAYIDALNAAQDETAILNQNNDSIQKLLDAIKTDSSCYKLVDLYSQMIANLTKDKKDCIEAFKHVPAVHDIKIVKDTVVDNAALKVCDEEKSKLINSIAPITNDRDRLKHGRNIWRIIALCALAVLGLGAFFKVKALLTPKLNS